MIGQTSQSVLETLSDFKAKCSSFERTDVSVLIYC